ncbi:uncharacterized protein LOC112569453 isoform X2 [Pomacea canaliculata]|uniref:uncharacterized protein LOC112569453 isoform X2 n=1 Tax=Pomacea canaliculata TaxID=400727 RepID=UPI000D72E7E0|nr:uncharacterized protein LOC112569453 isoform X2 [Pomacea canaliculata]
MQMGTVAVLLLVGLSVVEGVLISPCGDDGMREVLADQDTVFICTAEGRVQWRLRYQGSSRSNLLAECQHVCHEMINFNKLFTFSIIHPRHSSSLTIKAVNHTDSVELMNRSLECTVGEAGAINVARCDLNYVYPPELVICSAVNASWSVTVSCIIGSVYSSRGLYTCQIFLLKHGSKNESLGTVTMLTSPTSENIAKNEMKMTGSCQFNTTLPAEEGLYRFYVSVSPGGRTYQANFAADIWITTERPTLPIMSCAPQPYVLENTDVTCTCSAVSLGQPAACLRWIRGNKTNQWTASSEKQQNQVSYSQPLTLKDHENTWFRCDVKWGTEEIKGENFTANVGYSVKTLKILMNGDEQNKTTKEGQQVNMSCESDGRPTPEIAIYSNGNNTLIIKDTSPVNHTFIARCEDTATYNCSAWNEFSRQSGETTSAIVDIDVLCKPRSRSSTHLLVHIVNQQGKVHFDVIANPVPHEYRVGLVRSWMDHSESTDDNAEGSLINITCKPSKMYRYLFTCTLTVSKTPSRSNDSYKVQLINKVGDENFTVVISFAHQEDLESYNLTLPVAVVCVVVFIFSIAVLIVVMRKIKKSKESDAVLDSLEPPLKFNQLPVPLKVRVSEAEEIPGTSQPEPCQTPLYAVVNKTKRKENTRPAHIAEPGEQIKKINKPACEVVYAVVDKAGTKSAGRCDNAKLDNKTSKTKYGNYVS